MSTRRDVADVVEDLEFLNSTSVGAREAAERSGFPSGEALERWLYRNGRGDLWLAMKARDPEGSQHHAKTRRLHDVSSEHIDPIAALLAEGASSDRKRIRNKAERITALVDELRTDLAEDRQDAEVREKARKDIEKLEKQLADAKARLRGGRAQVDVGDGVSAAQLREWARRNGVECPSAGRVPAAVREAFAAIEEAS